MFWRAAVLLGLVSLLGACGGKTYAPVSDRSVSAAAQPRPDSYLVRKGDTLYSIAFRYGMDYRELARRNGIGRDYSIYPGQRLSLKNSSAKPASSSIVRDASITAPKPVITSSRDARQKRLIRLNNLCVAVPGPLHRSLYLRLLPGPGLSR